MTSAIKNTGVKRSLCTRCLRAESGCICQWIRPTASATEVLILQHPLEVREVKGSARLLSLSLSKSRIEVGETFSSAHLAALLTAPWSAKASEQCAKQPILLYPELTTEHACATQNALLSDQCTYPSQLRLVVIDASWRKSRKMIYLNPPLQSLPRLRLDALPASKYLIRKAHQADQRSSYEATCAALTQLEGPNEAFSTLIAAFEGFIHQQIQAKSRGIEQSNS